MARICAISGGALSTIVPAAFGKAVLRITALACLSGALAACGVSQLTAPFKNGLFGGGKQEPAASASASSSVTQGTLLNAAQTDQANGDLTTGSIGCPNFDVSASDRVLTYHLPGAGNDQLSVMHRGEITNTARECGPSANGMTVKYGFSGRVLLGPKGKAGSITLPAKVTVVDGSRSTLKTEQIRVIAEVPAGATSGYFSEVREIELPIPPGTSPKTYRIYIGFDQKAAGR